MPEQSFEQEYFEGAGKCLQSGRQQFKHLVLYFKLKIGQQKQIICLDTGCACGHLVKEARALGIQAFGLDISRYALNRAVADKGYFFQGDSCCIPFYDASFNVVTALEVVEHLPSPQKCMQECYRVLKPGGMLILSTPSEIGRINEPTHINEHPPEFWLKYLKEIDFNCKPYYLPLLLSEYDYRSMPVFLTMPSLALKVFLLSMRVFRLIPLRVRFYLESPFRKLLGIYFARRKNSFYVVAFKK